MSARKQATTAPLFHAVDLPPAALARLREEASHEIEKLIALLDTLDAPEADLEPDCDAEISEDDEPSLGSVENHPNPFRSINQGDQTSWAAGTNFGIFNVDCEGDEHDGSEPDEDDEPSLGWTTDGVCWGASDDREDEHDGAEPEATQ